MDAATTGMARASDVTGTPGQRVQDVWSHLRDRSMNTVQEAKASGAETLTSTREAVTSGAHDVALTYREVTSVVDDVSCLAQGAQAMAGVALRAATDSDLAESLIVSPLTGAAAETACVAASTTLIGFATETFALSVVTGAAVTAYQLVESALTVQAAALTGGLRTAAVTATGAARLGGGVLIDAARVNVAVTAATTSALAHVAAWRIAVAAAVAGAGAVAAGALAVTAVKNATIIAKAAGSALLRDPFNPLQPRASALRTGLHMWSASQQADFSLDEWERNAGALLDASPPGTYEAIVTSLATALSLSGRGDHGTVFVSPSDVTGLDPAHGVASYRDGLQRDHPELNQDYRKFRNPADLFNNAGEIDSIGQNSVGVIRIVVKTGKPPVFTVIIPSTQDWYSSSTVPNDLAGNLITMSGAESDLLKASKAALNRTLADYGVDPKQATVMVAGFSQGGITAARFAATYQHDYVIKEVITAGAPVGHIAIPDEISAIHYENRDDQVVRRLDLSANPETPSRETVHGKGGGHNAADYARTAADSTVRSAPNLSQFFSTDGADIEIRDHYVQRR